MAAALFLPLVALLQLRSAPQFGSLRSGEAFGWRARCTARVSTSTTTAGPPRPQALVYPDLELEPLPLRYGYIHVYIEEFYNMMDATDGVLAKKLRFVVLLFFNGLHKVVCLQKGLLLFVLKANKRRRLKG